MGFLFMLIIMCVFMLYGGFVYYTEVCSIKYEDGLLAALKILSSCTPWVAWVMFNSMLHFIWVTILLICQKYQVICKSLITAKLKAINPNFYHTRLSNDNQRKDESRSIQTFHCERREESIRPWSLQEHGGLL